MELKYFCFLVLHLAFAKAFDKAVLRPKLGGGRIIGGENTTIEAYPFQASLHYFHMHLCGASIISARWLITATHCTTLNSGYIHTPIRGFTVRIGTNRREAGGQELSVLKVIDHPQYLISEPTGLDSDISLLYLEKDVTFSTTVQPIRMPEPTEVYIPGTTATVLGWGVTYTESSPEILQKLDVPLISNENCEVMYNSWGIYNYITERMICAGFADGAKDACQGDSGGPLIVNNTLVGVVSWGNGCALPNSPGVYTNVEAFREWIRENTGV